MEKEALIIGAGGRLGQELVHLYGPRALAWTRSDVDITAAELTRAKIAALAPRLIINCAALTTVDVAEHYPDLAFKVNALGVRNIAEAAAEVGADLVQVSTDYVFDGQKGAPYTEEDPTGPVNYYGRSKLAGEYLATRSWHRTYIIRTGLLYGRFGRNYVQAVIDDLLAGKPVTVAIDQVASPTCTSDLAQAIQRIATSGRYGIYHVVNEGRASRRQLAEAVRAAVSRWFPEVMKVPLRPILLAEAGKIAPRPRDTTLSCAKIAQELAVQLRRWEEPLPEYVKYYLEHYWSGRIMGD